MAARFSVLASSSSGNCSYLDVDGAGILIDFGIGPRKLTRLLDLVQTSWDSISAVVLTHLHTDHWNESTLNLMVKCGTRLWCHTDHAAELEHRSEAFHDLQRAGLVGQYQANQTFELESCTCTPLPLWHDVVTYGFRFDGIHEPWALGYAADLGSWAGELVERLAEVDLLALEFNHDVAMQLSSRRDESLIERVLGDGGHLSNVQASKLLEEIVGRTAPGRLRTVVPLHMSRECNRHEHVHSAIEPIRARHGFVVQLADHAAPTPWLLLSEHAAQSASRHSASRHDKNLGRPQEPLFDLADQLEL